MDGCAGVEKKPFASSGSVVAARAARKSSHDPPNLSSTSTDIARAPDVYRLAANRAGIKVAAIAMHIGSQLTSLEPYRAAFGQLRALCQELLSRLDAAKQFGADIVVNNSGVAKVAPLVGIEYGF